MSGPLLSENPYLTISELKTQIEKLKRELATAEAANHWNAIHRDSLVVENQRLREQILAVRNWIDLEHLQRIAGKALLGGEENE